VKSGPRRKRATLPGQGGFKKALKRGSRRKEAHFSRQIACNVFMVEMGTA
jgi:hypothetical protein